MDLECVLVLDYHFSSCGTFGPFASELQVRATLLFFSEFVSPSICGLSSILFQHLRRYLVAKNYLPCISRRHMLLIYENREDTGYEKYTARAFLIFITLC